MQTFLPYSNFLTSAQVLDKKRCWKQVVEAKQIISCLSGASNVRWKNHPAIKMWVGYEDLLNHYYNVFLFECLHEHKIKTSLPYIRNKYTHTIGYDSHPCGIEDSVFLTLEENAKWYDKQNNLPFWYDDKNFHRSHRSRLIAKNRDFYLSKFPDDENYNDSLYWWPDMETKTFKLIVPKTNKIKI
jgi:Pyrimidine dimer DNA glycosylase